LLGLVRSTLAFVPHLRVQIRDWHRGEEATGLEKRKKKVPLLLLLCVNFSHSVVNFSFPFLSIDSKGLGHSKNIFPPPFFKFIDERMLNEKVKKKIPAGLRMDSVY
jgi:hypothetical protein